MIFSILRLITLEFRIEWHISPAVRNYYNHQGGWVLAALWRMHYPWALEYVGFGSMHKGHLWRSVWAEGRRDVPIYIANPDGSARTISKWGAYRFKTQKDAIRWRNEWTWADENYKPVRLR